MSLAVKPDELDYADPYDSTDVAEDIFEELFDPDHPEHHYSSLPRVDILLNGTNTTGLSSDVNDATALRWQYEERMAVLGLAVGSIWRRSPREDPY